MELIWFYLLFATTTAIVAIYELIWPVLSSMKVTHPEVNVAHYWKTSVFCFFLLNFVLAPVMIYPCLNPAAGERFRKALHSNLLSTP